MQDEKNNMLSNQIKIALKNKLKKACIEFLNKEPLIKYIFIICFIIVYIFQNEYIEIDNEIQLYEKNINYSNFETDIKSIALYLPQFH